MRLFSFFLLFIFLFSICGCKKVASSEALIETRKDLNLVAKNVENLAKDHAKLVNVVSEGLQLPIETKKSLNDNANKIVGDSKEITKHTEKRTTENVNAFSFADIIQAVYKVAEWAEPVITALNKVAGDNPYGAVIISVITLISTLVGKGTLDNIAEKKKLKKKVLVAKRANPKAIEEYEALEKQVDEEIKTGKIKL